MFVTTDKPAPAESGLAALVLLLRFHNIGADSEQIRHRFGNDIGVSEMLRCAKEFGLKARTYQSSWQRLIKTPLPASRYCVTATISLSARPVKIRFSFKIHCCRDRSSCRAQSSRRSGMAVLC